MRDTWVERTFNLHTNKDAWFAVIESDDEGIELRGLCHDDKAQAQRHLAQLVADLDAGNRPSPGFWRGDAFVHWSEAA